MSEAPQYFEKLDGRYVPLDRQTSVGWPMAGYVYASEQGFQWLASETPALQLDQIILLASLVQYQTVWAQVLAPMRIDRVPPDGDTSRPEGLDLVRAGAPGYDRALVSLLLAASAANRDALVAALMRRAPRLGRPLWQADGPMLYRKVGGRYRPAGERFERFPAYGVWHVPAAADGVFRHASLEHLCGIPTPTALDVLEARRPELEAAVRELRTIWEDAEHALTTMGRGQWLSTNECLRHLWVRATGAPATLGDRRFGEAAAPAARITPPRRRPRR